MSGGRFMDHYARFRADGLAEIRAAGRDSEFTGLTRRWIDLSAKHRYTYHFDWMGRPAIQFPQDMLAVQELVWRIRPEVIIEVGVAHGGSLVFSASLLAMLDYAEAVQDGRSFDPRASVRRAIGIDIDIRPHNREAIEAHPMAHLIRLVEGSSVDPEIVAQVHALARTDGPVLVILDSNHTHDHVLAELEAYGPLVTPGSYCIVFDTVIENMAPGSFPDRPWDVGNNPMTALRAWLKTRTDFVIDTDIADKLQITVAPDGFLRRQS